MKVDIKKVKQTIKKLDIPPEYFRLDLDKFFNRDYTMLLSIRQDAGKTTQALLLGLVLFKEYGITTEYLRNDNAQITRKDIENLYGVVVKFGYIQKLYGVQYNDIEYKQNQKKFFLVHKDEDGNIDNTCYDPLCAVHSNENWRNLKSSYNNPNGDYIVLDEFMDTSRATYHIFTEFMNNISTIGRPDAPGREPHVLMLGNNSDQYCFWFDDFCISDQIANLRYGGAIEMTTDLGTTLYCSLLEPSETQKQRKENKKIKFFGFNTRKAAQFIGTVEWSGNNWQHLDFDLDYDELVFRRLYIKHRGRYIQIEVFDNEEKGRFLFFHFAREPQLDDNVILTLEPSRFNEIYGMGDYSPKIWKRLKKIFQLRVQNRAYYSSNMVGELVADYIKNCK